MCLADDDLLELQALHVCSEYEKIIISALGETQADTLVEEHISWSLCHFAHSHSLEVGADNEIAPKTSSLLRMKTRCQHLMPSYVISSIIEQLTDY